MPRFLPRLHGRSQFPGTGKRPDGACREPRPGDFWAGRHLAEGRNAIQVREASPLYGETAERGEAGAQVKAAKRELYMTYVTARRSVNEYFVYGPGSRALLALGNDGS